MKFYEPLSLLDRYNRRKVVLNACPNSAKGFSICIFVSLAYGIVDFLTQLKMIRKPQFIHFWIKIEKYLAHFEILILSLPYFYRLLSN